MGTNGKYSSLLDDNGLPTKEKKIIIYPNFPETSLHITSNLIYFSSFHFQKHSRQITYPPFGTSLVIIPFLFFFNQLCWKHYLLIIHYRVDPHLVVYCLHSLYMVLIQCIKDEYFCVLAGIGNVRVFVIVC